MKFTSTNTGQVASKHILHACFRHAKHEWVHLHPRWGNVKIGPQTRTSHSRDAESLSLFYATSIAQQTLRDVVHSVPLMFCSVSPVLLRVQFRGNHGLEQLSFALWRPSMGSEQEIPFPQSITLPSSSGSLALLGHGITDITIETIHVIFTRIGVYFEPSIKDHLQAWKGQPVPKLVKEGSGFFKQLIEAPVRKLVKIVLIKGQKGSQYAGALESSIRDRLAYDDKYEEEEEEALAKLSEFFQSKKLDPNSSIVYSWAPTNSHLEVSVYQDGSLITGTYNVNNKHVATAILDWILGENSISPSTVESVAGTVVSLS